MTITALESKISDLESQFYQKAIPEISLGECPEQRLEFWRQCGDLAQAYEQLAEAQVRQRDFKAAVVAYWQATLLNPAATLKKRLGFRAEGTEEGSLSASLADALDYPEGAQDCFFLGLQHLSGLGVSQNAQYAAAYFRMAASRSHVDAKLCLGFCYELGLGVSQSDWKALMCFKQVSKQGEPLAMTAMGWCYEAGQGVAKNEKEAARFYQQAAEKGEVSALNALGTLYADGRGVVKDAVKAVALYRQAAEAGFAPAQNNLGGHYVSGEGVAQSDQLAAHWTGQAAAQDDVIALYNLAEMYQEGFGVSQNIVLAKQYYQKAAVLGDTEAENALRVMTTQQSVSVVSQKFTQPTAVSTAQVNRLAQAKPTHPEGGLTMKSHLEQKVLKKKILQAVEKHKEMKLQPTNANWRFAKTKDGKHLKHVIFIKPDQGLTAQEQVAQGNAIVKQIISMCDFNKRSLPNLLVQPIETKTTRWQKKNRYATENGTHSGFTMPASMPAGTVAIRGGTIARFLAPLKIQLKHNQHLLNQVEKSKPQVRQTVVASSTTRQAVQAETPVVKETNSPTSSLSTASAASFFSPKSSKLAQAYNAVIDLREKQAIEEKKLDSHAEKLEKMLAELEAQQKAKAERKAERKALKRKLIEKTEQAQTNEKALEAKRQKLSDLEARIEKAMQIQNEDSSTESESSEAVTNNFFSRG